MEGGRGEVYRVDSGKLGCETSELTRPALLALEHDIVQSNIRKRNIGNSDV